MHCFTGCSVETVLNSLGLKFDNLFPEPPEKPDYKKSKRCDLAPKLSRYDLFPKLVFEANILALAITDLLAGATLSQTDRARIDQAIETIMRLRCEVGL